MADFTSKPICKWNIDEETQKKLMTELLEWGKREVVCRKQYNDARKKGEPWNTTVGNYEVIIDGKKCEYNTTEELSHMIILLKEYGMYDTIFYQLILKHSELLLKE